MFGLPLLPTSMLVGMFTLFARKSTTPDGLFNGTTFAASHLDVPRSSHSRRHAEALYPLPGHSGKQVLPGVRQLFRPSDS